MTVSEIQRKYFWFINGDRMAIVEKNQGVSGESYTSVTTGGLHIRVEYVTRAIPFSDDLTESSEIPDQFHESLAYKVISDLYKLPGEKTDFQAAQYFDSQYLMQVKEAKKYASRHKVSGGYIKPVDF